MTPSHDDLVITIILIIIIILRGGRGSKGKGYMRWGRDLVHPKNRPIKTWWLCP